ncbi:MAG: 16S rRNA (uracil(1498)-N(3))-methyltransferase [Coxiella sp. (in: Bacteria)]|nr:MAG: 16S rRNA (uracil(1498)-N(3))-methyltransferase [Coxiella sp. (in: g-proteobacteria)]
MIRIFQETPLGIGEDVCLDRFASQHLLTVLRLRKGEQFVTFNGQGGEYHVELVDEQKKCAVVHVVSHDPIDRESPLAVHLGQGLSRGERMDYAIQKSVELGVAAITPLITERCNVKLSAERLQKRLDHWRKVIISACEQSGRTRIPTIHPPQRMNDWIDHCEGLRFICDFNESAQADTTKATKASLLIGPEGGLTDDEMSYAHQNEFLSLSLGPRVLRTETATVAALTKLQMRYGDLVA